MWHAWYCFGVCSGVIISELLNKHRDNVAWEAVRQLMEKQRKERNGIKTQKID
jgi:hypothetical protein